MYKSCWNHGKIQDIAYNCMLDSFVYLTMFVPLFQLLSLILEKSLQRYNNFNKSHSTKKWLNYVGEQQQQSQFSCLPQWGFLDIWGLKGAVNVWDGKKVN